jgi:DNA-binding NarL/FixJ family response regulator
MPPGLMWRALEHAWGERHSPATTDLPITMRLAEPPGALRLAPERMTRRPRSPADRATEREVGVVAAVLVSGSEKAAAHRLGRSRSTVRHHLANARSKVGATTTARLGWILGVRLAEPEARADEHRSTTS